MSNNHYLLLQASIICLLLFFLGYDSDDSASRLVSVTFSEQQPRSAVTLRPSAMPPPAIRGNEMMPYSAYFPERAGHYRKLAMRVPNGWQAECQLGLANVL
jgi:hypothetical protein